MSITANSWVEVDVGALAHNLGEFRRRLPAGTFLGAVVKSEAYGHGLEPAARAFLEAGADWLCVNQLDEALRLRAIDYAGPILIMGYVPLARLAEAVGCDARIVVYNLKTLEALADAASAAGKVCPVHLKLETGTGRQGLTPAELKPLLESLSSRPSIKLEGAYTHFANIEDTTDHSYSELQIKRFEEGLETLAAAGHSEILRHTACSAAAILFPKTHLDLVRLGIALYGIWPSRETLVSARELGDAKIDLRPALTWKTRVAQVKQVPEGEYVGYGCTARTTRDSRIAVLPVGYYEGYPRALSGVAHVLIDGRRAPLIGRICMNLCMVDVTDVPRVELEDEVVLLGKQGEDSIPVERLAGWAGTIPYEIFARIHPGLPRVTECLSSSPEGRNQ